MSERHTRQGQPGRQVAQMRGPDEYEELDWPGRKPGRGGSAHVTASHTISAGGCWCGERYGHDWPGKADGEPHPRQP